MSVTSPGYCSFLLEHKLNGRRLTLGIASSRRSPAWVKATALLVVIPLQLECLDDLSPPTKHSEPLPI
jgi:hypothetical protein